MLHGEERGRVASLSTIIGAKHGIGAFVYSSDWPTDGSKDTRAACRAQGQMCSCFGDWSGRMSNSCGAYNEKPPACANLRSAQPAVLEQL